MSEVTKPDRTVDTVTAEIQYIQQQVKKIFYDAVVQIGTRLLEVKEMVPHGEWTNYLENRLGYKPSTAQNYMRIAKEFGVQMTLEHCTEGTDKLHWTGRTRRLCSENWDMHSCFRCCLCQTKIGGSLPRRMICRLCPVVRSKNS